MFVLLVTLLAQAGPPPARGPSDGKPNHFNPPANVRCIKDSFGNYSCSDGTRMIQDSFGNVTVIPGRR